MTGRRLFWIVLVMSVWALLAQAKIAQRHWRASRILRVVETVSMQASQRGGLPRRLGDHHLRLLGEAAELDPALVDVQVARGWQYLLLGRPQGAIRAFEEALELEPRARVWANLGEAHMKAGNHAEARQAYEKAIELDPLLAKELESQLSRVRAP